MAILQELIGLQEQMAVELENAFANIKKAPLDRRNLDLKKNGACETHAQIICHDIILKKDVGGGSHTCRRHSRHKVLQPYPHTFPYPK